MKRLGDDMREGGGGLRYLTHRWTTVILCGLFLVILFGCGGVPQQKQHQNQQEEQPASITLTLWTLQLKSFANLIEPMLAEFESEHAGVTVKWVDVPFNQGEKRMLTAVMSGHVPDVVNLNPEFSALLTQRGALVDMNQAIEPEVREQYVPVVWKAVSKSTSRASCLTLSESESELEQESKSVAHSCLEQSPKAVGLPWYVTSRILMLNEGLLHQVGWKAPPDTPQSLARLVDDVAQYNKTHPDKPPIYAMMPPLGKSGYVFKQLFLDGVIDDWQQLDSTPAIEWLERWVSWYQQGVLPAESALEGPQAALDRYQSGRLMMMEAGANYLNIVKDNAPTVYSQTKVMPQWAGHPRRLSFSTMLLAVPEQSEHQALAVELAAFVTQGKYQLALSKAAPVLPSVQSALQDDYFTQALKTDSKVIKASGTEFIDRKTLLARRLSALQLGQAQEVLPNRPRQKEAFAWVDHYVQSALLGTMNVPQALQSAKIKLSELWDEPLKAESGSRLD